MLGWPQHSTKTLPTLIEEKHQRPLLLACRFIDKDVNPKGISIYCPLSLEPPEKSLKELRA